MNSWGGVLSRVENIEDDIDNIKDNINDIETSIDNIEKANDIITVNLSSTAYCAQYKSGYIGYSVRNGICIISIKNLLFTDQTTSGYKEHIFTGFPTNKIIWSSGRLINGTINVGEIYINNNATNIIVRSVGTSSLWGSLVYFTD